MSDYFSVLEKIVKQNPLVIDRPKGSVHPRYPDYVYPLDYGYIKDTTSQDGGGIDVWAGSGDRSLVVGILVIIDPVKKDSEIKVLLGCSDNEIEQANQCSSRGAMRAFVVKRPKA